MSQWSSSLASWRRPPRISSPRLAPIRAAARGTVATDSIPLTRLCRDRCGSCTFATAPRTLDAPNLSPEEVLAIASAGGGAGCHEALFTLVEATEDRYPVAREWISEHGYRKARHLETGTPIVGRDQGARSQARVSTLTRGMSRRTPSTVDYLAAMCSVVLEETGLLHHANAGALNKSDLATLRPGSVSQGMMLERLPDLAARRGAADKTPFRRRETFSASGRLAIPFTSPSALVTPGPRLPSAHLPGAVAEVLAGVRDGQRVEEEQMVTLLSARGPEVAAVAALADELRQTAVGDTVTYVVNRALEVHEGAHRVGEPIAEYLIRLEDAGLSSLPGTAAEILDDEVRVVLCPDKVTTREWLDTHEVAHGVGLYGNVTMMFGSIERLEHVARHIVHNRDLQARTEASPRSSACLSSKWSRPAISNALPAGAPRGARRCSPTPSAASLITGSWRAPTPLGSSSDWPVPRNYRGRVSTTSGTRSPTRTSAAPLVLRMDSRSFPTTSSSWRLTEGGRCESGPVSMSGYLNRSVRSKPLELGIS